MIDVFSFKDYSESLLCPFCDGDTMQDSDSLYVYCKKECLPNLDVELQYQYSLNASEKLLTLVRVARDDVVIHFLVHVNFMRIIFLFSKKPKAELKIHSFNIESLTKNNYKEILNNLLVFS